MKNDRKFIDKKVVELKTLYHAFTRDDAVMKQKYPGVYCVYNPVFEFLETKVFIDVDTVNEMFPKLIKPTRLEMTDNGDVMLRYNYIYGFAGGNGETMMYSDVNRLQECSKEYVTEIITKLNNTLGETLRNYNEFSGVVN